MASQASLHATEWPGTLPDDLQAWREESLTLLLRMMCLLGLPAVPLDIVGSLQRGRADWAAIDVLGIVILVGLTIHQRMAYRTRALLLALTMGCYGCLLLLNLGAVGPGGLHIALSTLLAAVLLRQRDALVVGSIFPLAALGILGAMAFGALTLPAAALQRAADSNTLLVSAVSIALAAALLGGVVFSLIRRLSSSLVAVRVALAERDTLNTDLERLVAERTDELRRSRQLLQNLLDHSPAAVYVKDLEGRYLIVNSYMCQAHALAPEQMIGRSDAELFGVPIEPWRAQEQEIVAQGHSIAREQNNHEPPSGRTYYVIGFPLRDSAGAIHAIGGIAADISDRKQAEQTLQQQTRHAHALARCSAALLANVEYDGSQAAALMEALDHLLAALAASRAYVYELLPGAPHPEAAVAVAEVCAPGVTSSPRTGRIPGELLPDALVAALRAGEANGGSVAELLAERPAYAALLQSADVGSVLYVPIQTDALWGFLGLSDPDPGRAWQPGEIQLLQTAAEMVAAFIRSRRLLQTLKERDHFIQQVTDASPDMIYVYDLRAQRNVFTSREIGSVLGYTRAEIQSLGADLLRVVLSPEDFARLPELQAASIAAADNEVVEFAYRARHKNGGERWLLSREVVFARDGEGRATQLLGIARDITGRQEAQIELERREALLRTINDTLPNGYLFQLVQRRDGARTRYNYVSAGVEQVFGLTPAQVRADPRLIYDSIHEDDRAAYDAADLASVRDRTIFEIEVRHRTRDGAPKWVQVRSIPTALEGDELLWSGVVLEVTARKETELALQRSNTALSQRLGELGALNQIAQALMSWDNLPAALRTVGALLIPLFGAEQVAVWIRPEQGASLTRLALVSRAFSDLSTATVQLREAPLARGALAAGRATVVDGSRYDRVVAQPVGRTSDGAGGGALVQPLVVRGAPVGLVVIRAEAGRAPYSPADVELAQTIAGMLGGALENGRLFQEKMAAVAEEERRRLARELHDSVTQQLYSTVLLSRAWARMAGREGPEAIAGWFGQIQAIAQQSLKEMRLLIYQLRSDELDRLGLADALRHRLEAVEARAGVAAGLDVDEYRQPASPEQEPQLLAIAIEALNNALRHAQATNIGLTLRSDAATLTLTIGDDGKGFDPGQASAGLGLTTMRERAERLGGTLQVASAPDAGTRVTVTIPLDQAPPPRTAGTRPVLARRRRR
jgi:PAS domain S-box-containing protein